MLANRVVGVAYDLLNDYKNMYARLTRQSNASIPIPQLKMQEVTVSKRLAFNT